MRHRERLRRDRPVGGRRGRPGPVHPVRPDRRHRARPLPGVRPALRAPAGGAVPPGRAAPARGGGRRPPRRARPGGRAPARVGVLRAGGLAGARRPRRHRRVRRPRGTVRFPGPADPAPRRCFGREGYWLRVRWAGGVFPLRPGCAGCSPTRCGRATSRPSTEEILGSGTGNANQTFTTAQTPVQPGHQLLVRERERPPADEERVLRAEEGDDAVVVDDRRPGLPDEVWVRWHAVPDLYGSGPRDRHYVLDALTGRVRFGDGTGGMAPPSGAEQRAPHLPGRAAVPRGTARPGPWSSCARRSRRWRASPTTSRRAAGRTAEPLERLAARGPRVLRHRDRAVAAPDLEDLAAAASPDVARAVAIVPSFNPFMLWLDPGAPDRRPTTTPSTAGRVGIVVVPRADPGSGVERPTPSLGLLREVREHVAQRLPATAELWVAGPEWVVATVAVTVVPDRPDRADAVADTRAVGPRDLPAPAARRARRHRMGVRGPAPAVAADRAGRGGRRRRPRPLPAGVAASGDPGRRPGGGTARPAGTAAAGDRRPGAARPGGRRVAEAGAGLLGRPHRVGARSTPDPSAPHPDEPERTVRQCPSPCRAWTTAPSPTSPARRGRSSRHCCRSGPTTTRATRASSSSSCSPG